MCRRWALLGVLVVLCAVVGVASATPILTSTATQQADGTWLYSYEVENPSQAIDYIYDIYADIPGATLSIATPAGWLNMSTGFQFVEWMSWELMYDIGPGQTLGGFGYTHAWGPTSGDVVLYSENYLGDYHTYTLAGDVPYIPEPATLVLTGLGVAAAFGWRRRRKS